MKINRRELALMPAALSAQAPETNVTHGPFLGHVTETEVWVWGRTARSGTVRVRYGTSPGNLDQTSAPVATTLDHDNAAWIRIGGLAPGTRYHYRLDGGGQPGTFQTLPSADQHRDAETNPRGLFNFRFAFGSCAQQRIDPSLPVYKLLRERHAPQLLFGIMNGDWLYEEKRDFPADQWRRQVGISDAQTPRIVNLAPSITGVWENYKFYLERGKTLAAWHRDMPGYFTPDDHEILNDVYGTGTAGVRTREAVFRDISMHAWYDYIAGSNPLATTQGLLFGEAEIDGNALTSDDVDFTKVDWSQASNVHVHWGGQLAGVLPNANRDPGNPNAGVYDVDEVLGARRLRIRPAGRQKGRCVFSIGRHNYSKFRVGNVEVYLLDTRGSRDMHDTAHPERPGPSILGRRQREWLKRSMAASDADFFFLASSVNLMIPHVGTPGSVNPLDGKDDAWTAFLPEREEMIQFWDSLGKPVMVMTGDLHNSFSVKVTDRVWEFGAGPHNSQNHPAVSEGNRPANGPFDSRGRKCEVRWSSYIRLDVPPALRRWRVYAIAQINNVFPNPKEAGKMRWVAYPKPHVVIQYYDGQTGELLYAEPVHHHAS